MIRKHIRQALLLATTLAIAVALAIGIAGSHDNAHAATATATAAHSSNCGSKFARELESYLLQTQTLIEQSLPKHSDRLPYLPTKQQRAWLSKFYASVNQGLNILPSCNVIDPEPSLSLAPQFTVALYHSKGIGELEEWYTCRIYRHSTGLYAFHECSGPHKP